jgi:hypothetical protein
MPEVTTDAIARRAYELFLARGSSHGRDLDHGLAPHRAVRANRPRTKSNGTPKRGKLTPRRGRSG